MYNDDVELCGCLLDKYFPLFMDDDENSQQVMITREKLLLAHLKKSQMTDCAMACDLFGYTITMFRYVTTMVR